MGYRKSKEYLNVEIIFVSMLLGFVVGAILALTGAGATIIAVPLLTFGLHLEVAEAAPIALLAICLASTIAAVHAHLQGCVRYRAAGFIAITGIIAAPIGLWFAHKLPNEPLALLFASVLFLVAVDMWRHAVKQPPIVIGGIAMQPASQIPSIPCQLEYSGGRLIWTWPCARALGLAGAMTGFLSGLLGVGGGFVVVPALKKASNLDMPSVVATSLAVVALISAIGVMSATAMSKLNWPLAISFAGGTLLGMLIGRMLSLRLTGPRLQQGFAIVAMGISAAMIIRAMSILLS